jgi:thioredoxin-dependent peroxiredoxin
MAQIKLGEDNVHTNGDLPTKGSTAPPFVLTANDLSEVPSKNFAGKNVVLNIFPSIDTRVCAMSVREFNKRASSMNNTVVVCISRDLPFAFRRFCGAEGIDKVVTLSDFKNKDFAKNYGVEMVDGRMAGLHARSIVVIDPQGKIKHTEMVPVIGQEPDYEAALKELE